MSMCVCVSRARARAYRAQTCLSGIYTINAVDGRRVQANVIKEFAVRVIVCLVVIVGENDTGRQRGLGSLSCDPRREKALPCVMKDSSLKRSNTG
jgi:hypothetical protein